MSQLIPQALYYIDSALYQKVYGLFNWYDTMPVWARDIVGNSFHENMTEMTAAFATEITKLKSFENLWPYFVISELGLLTIHWADIESSGEVKVISVVAARGDGE